MKFNHNNGGRLESKRPKQTNDCVIRAVAIVCGVSYDESYELFKDEGRKNGRGVLPKVWKPILKDGVFDTKFEYFAFPATSGRPRMTVEKFCDEFSSGIFVIRTAKHLAVVIDGVLQDTVFHENYTALRCVYGAYQVIAHHDGTK